MKLFLDTSVLVAAAIKSHHAHQRSLGVVAKVQSGKDEGVLAGHGLAETYSVMTRLPAPFRHTPELALLSIEENFVKHFKILSLTGNDYVALLRDSALAGIQGGTIYDAILLRCAEIAKADRIYTLNLRHFQGIAKRPTAALLSEP